MRVEVLSSEFISRLQVETVPIDLNVATNCEVSWSYEGHALINVLVLSSL